MKLLIYTLAVSMMILNGLYASAEEPLLTPPQIWADYDPNKGDFKEEIVKEETREGNYYRESYISATVLGEDVRVCDRCCVDRFQSGDSFQTRVCQGH
jgi:hypothetical protein